MTTPTVAPPFRYLDLADRLTRALAEGRYPPGTRLPSVRELCDAHDASLATVTHALHRLEDAGLIEARPRQGFFACDAAMGGERIASALAPEALDTRRERLMALAAAQAGQLSLGHLAPPEDLLPLATLRKLSVRHLRDPAAALAGGTVAGSAALRESIAARLARRGCTISADDIVVTHGEGEALQLCLQQFTQPGDRVAVTRPVPLRALELLNRGGLEVEELPAAAHGAQVVEALEALLREGRVSVCIADLALSEAAGTQWDDEARRAFVALCGRQELPLIECDLLGELPVGSDEPRPLKAFDDSDRVLHCGSLACITGPGFSVGWVASGRHRLQLRAARAVHGELLPPLTDHVLADFLSGDDIDRHLRHLRRQLKARVKAWTAAVLAAFPAGTRVSHGAVGYQLWVTQPSSVNALTLLARAREHGISFVPGAVFTASDVFDHSLRLTCAHALDAQRRPALQRIGALAAAEACP